MMLNFECKVGWFQSGKTHMPCHAVIVADMKVNDINKASLDAILEAITCWISGTDSNLRYSVMF